MSFADYGFNGFDNIDSDDFDFVEINREKPQRATAPVKKASKKAKAVMAMLVAEEVLEVVEAAPDVQVAAEVIVATDADETYVYAAHELPRAPWPFAIAAKVVVTEVIEVAAVEVTTKAVSLESFFGAIIEAQEENEGVEFLQPTFELTAYDKADLAHRARQTVISIRPAAVHRAPVAAMQMALFA